MAVTYTTAAARDARSSREQRLRRISRSELALAATSCLAVFAILLAYLGRVTVLDQSEHARAAVPVNLNTVGDAAALDAAMAAAFPDAAVRRAAADSLFRFLVDQRQQGRTLANVGAIARATGPSGAALFSAADFALLKPLFVVRTNQEFRRLVILFASVYVLAFYIPPIVWRLRGRRSDLLLVAVTHLLTAIGFAALLSRPDPLRDTLLFVRFAEVTAISVVLMTALSLVDFGAAAFVSLSYLPLIGALSLSVLLILFGSGPGTSHARVNLGPFQPIEVIRLLLALFLAGYFARRWELLRELRAPVFADSRWRRWTNVPRAEYALPVVAGVGLALVFFFIQKDLGPALLLCCVFLAVYAVARGRAGMAIGGLLLLTLGFYVGYALHISHTLVDRVRMWQSPWDNSVPGGDQVAHAIWAAATGGSFGSGLGLGDPRYLPAGHTDLILAGIGEELGAAGLIIVAALYAILAWRALRIAKSARNDYGFFLATALTLVLIVPALIMASGVLGVTPLTGIVTPFLSYGGSAMVANFCAIGMLAAIHADVHGAGDAAPFRIPIRWLERSLAVAALALILVAVNIQIVHGDENLVRPHLGTQADGGRRFAYNPRVLDLVRMMPRGTIYDRRRVPLATDDAGVIASARLPYAKLGIKLDDVCSTSGERCYPLEGAAFHVLGDARSRLNWSASNTSYVERDAENRLRGFDDHAETIQTTDAAGRPMLTVRRDYRDVLPAVRHRHNPTDPSLTRLRRPHDVVLTIDANLQTRVAAIVETYAKRAAGKAAAVVIDPDTGDLLASASYPWPTMFDTPTRAAAIDSGTASDALLDRGRYGLYPPGSTFKLVTASAALRQHVDPRATRFTCERLPDGRIGAKIDGWHRPVRDDVLDTRPHGTIDEHQGFVHSCNAYFAQLAVRLGSRPLADAANCLGISLTPASNTLSRIRETLPQIGYGQADVVTTPLRMARVAAAVASNGVLRDVRWEQNPRVAPTTARFLDTNAARLLAGYMRDVVLSGTGRSLRDHPGRIAGKTGTAEVDGRPSHSWFVGFAPFGAAPRHIAFAVIVENAGYGAASAAPAAGEIVSAAAAAGLLK
jgi:cell division protein FtsW (lipid II flippase)